MSNPIKFVKPPATDEGFDYPRAHVVDPNIYRIVIDENKKDNVIEFGRNPKDVIMFGIYDNQNNLVKNKYVKPIDRFARKTFDFKDYNNTRRVGTISIIDKKFEFTENNEVIVSPTHELRELGETSGSFNVGIAMKNESIGSHESTANLVIQDISPSRTEIKIIPTSLKTSIRPAELALNNEYHNFYNKLIPISHIFHQIESFLRSTGVLVRVNELKSNNFLIKDFETKILELVDYFNFNSTDDFSQECDLLFGEIKDLYLNIFLWKYTSVFKQSDFLIEYIKCVDFVLDRSKRFLGGDNSEELMKHKNLYREVLVDMYDKSVAKSIYTEKFDTYLTNIMMFNQHQIVVLSVSRGIENKSSNEKHSPLIFKLHEPLPVEIKRGDEFYLNSSIYSDDIIQRVLLYKKTKPKVFKLRNPDLSGLVGKGTRQYNSEQLKKTESEIKKNNLLNLQTDDPGILEKIKQIEEEMREETFGVPIKITEEISNYFNNKTEDYYLSVDYSDFKNFVRYSSARKRLDVFIFKLTKISEIDRNVESIRNTWRNSTPEKFSRMSYDSQIKELTDKKLEILNNLDGYERFLYFEDITELSEEAREVKTQVDELKLKISVYGDDSGELKNKVSELEKRLLYTYVSWPRSDFNCETQDEWEETIYDYVEGDAVIYNDSIYIVKSGNNPTPNDIPGQSDSWELFCKCGECFGKKIPLNSAKYSFLSSRSYFRPMPIPATMEEFSRTTGYTWYAQKAKEADAYDKYNDNSFLNNTPEFITRDAENTDYFDFLSFIGHQFDLVHLYVEGIGNIRRASNDPSDGIPNEMVSHMLGFFGGSFEGYDEGELSALTTQVKTEEQLNYIKRFKEKKHIIWRRILNNLPYILKTIGTEKSIRALFRCYGVPDYLFRIREFGGIEYNTETNDKVLYTFDHFDYSLVFSKPNQHLSIDWKTNNYQSKSVEFNFSLNENLIDLLEKVEIVSGVEDFHIGSINTEDMPQNWVFGFEPIVDGGFKSSNIGWGKFYFNISSNGMTRKEYIKDKTGKDMVYPFGGIEYNILIQISESTRWTDMGVQIYVKRYSDEDLVYNGQSKISLREENIAKFLSPKHLLIGNAFKSNFFGKLNRLRTYSKPIKESRFENHIKFNQSYDISDPFDLENTLLFKANFDYPYKLNECNGDEIDKCNTTSGYIQNSSLRKDTSTYAIASNFNVTEFPYDFIGENKRQVARLPSYGSQVFNNNKIRIESQELETQLSVSKRSTKKSGDRFTIDTNKLGVYFSPSDILNHEILRFFGDFELGDYIGDPSELYNKTYKGFREVQNLFFKNGFGRVDFSNYLSILESYLDPSLFKNIEKVIPARTLLMSGLVVEPTLLERSKIQRKPIENEILVYDDLVISAGLKSKKIIKYANERNYYNITEDDITGFKTNLKVDSKKSNTLPSELDYNRVMNIPNELMYGINSYRGITSNYLIEIGSKIYTRYVESNLKNKIYQAIRIYGKILPNSEINAEVYGETTQDFYVHKDAKLNNLPIIGNYIKEKEYDQYNFAKFKFNFSGHMLSGKVKGIANIVLQNGEVKNISVDGRIGGRTFFDCDLKKPGANFTGIIKNLIDTKKLQGTYLKTNIDKKFIQIDEIKENSDINKIIIPKKVDHEVKINLSNKTVFKLKNKSRKYINAKGRYSCRINMKNKVKIIPPEICSFSISWGSEDKKTGIFKNILNIKNSSYDYVDNLSCKTELDTTELNEDFELPTLEVSDTTSVFKNVKSGDEVCENKKGRYDVLEVGSVENNDYITLETHIGGITQKKNYNISVLFNQPLRIQDRGKHSALDLKFRFDKGMFLISLNSNNNEIKKIDTGRYQITGNHLKNFYDVEDNILRIQTSYNEDFNTGDVLYLTDMKWTHSQGEFEDYNNHYYKIKKVHVTENSQLLDLQLPVHIKTANGSEKIKYIEGGVIHKLPSNFHYNYETENSIYKLDVNLNYHRDETKVVYPVRKNGISIGNLVNIVFREGSFLWVSKGIRFIERAEVVDVSKINNPISKLYNEVVVKIKVDKEIFGESTIEIVPSADYVYGFEVIADGNESSNYFIDFKQSFDTQLGPDPSQLSLREIPVDVNVKNKLNISSQFEYYNIIDIGNVNRKILNGPLQTHYKFSQHNRIQTQTKSLININCRRSVSTLNNTISQDGSPDVSPPIVRTRKASLRDGMGDSFWYLEDKTYATYLPCGVSKINELDDEDTLTENVSVLDLDSLVLHLDFENVDDTDEKIIDKSKNSFSGDMNNALLRSGGEARNYKKVLFLDNNITEDSENFKSYINFNLEESPLVLRKCTMSFWIKPIGLSSDNSGIIFNNSNERNQSHGLVLNPNGNKLSIGYAWKSSKNSHLVDLNVKLSEEDWTHVTVMFYEVGVVNVFINKVFSVSYDLGVEHEEISFANLEIGRFSGMIDDIRVYSDNLDYGDVELGQDSTNLVASLFDLSRKTKTSTDLTDGINCDRSQFLSIYDFEYYQPRQVKEASYYYAEYEHAKDDETLSPEKRKKMKFQIDSGPNQGEYKYGTIEYMANMCGNIKEAT